MPLPVLGSPTRRRLLSAAAVAGLVPLAGCDGSPLEADDVEDAAAPEGTDPDEALLVEAVGHEERMVAALQALLPRAPRRVRPTLQVHEAHLAVLRGAAEEREDDGAGEDREAIEDSPDSDDAGAPRDRLTLRGVSAAEERLSRRHADAAVRASSGPFARVLAGMAAAAAQQADVWRGGSAT